MAKIELTCIWFATRNYHLKTKNCWYRNSCHRRKVERRNFVGCYGFVGCCCVLFGIVAQSFKPVKLLATCKRTQQLSTLLGQQCWELLSPFARSRKAGRGSEAKKILFAKEHDGRASISPFLSCNFL